MDEGWTVPQPVKVVCAMKSDVMVVFHMLEEAAGIHAQALFDKLDRVPWVTAREGRLAAIWIGCRTLPVVLGTSLRQLKGASGGYVIDTDGVRYLDMVSAWGANLLGYGYPRIAKAMAAQAWKHANLGVAGPDYHTLRDLRLRNIPCAEEIHLLKNGSDATAAAIRLARYVTGREKILHRGYHGAQDWCMASFDCPGVPKSQREKIIGLKSLDCEGVRQVLAENPGEIACLILDPFCWPIPDREAITQRSYQ